ncbi:MAG: porin [Halieaceae bacterium]|nr:porin [Halieaceae bacterium]
MKLASTHAKVLLLAASLAVPAHAQQAPATAATDPTQSMDMAQVIALLKQQQKELAEQRQRLDEQAGKISSLTAELDALRGAPAAGVDPVVATAPTGDSSPKTDTPEPLSPDQLETASAASGPEPAADAPPTDEEAVAIAQADDPTQDLLSSFPGAWRLPGTNSAFKVGGFVRTAIVYNQDVLEIPDRFIVGSIPVGTNSDENAAQSSITADQSRLSFDYRETTSAGILRAFVDGDFTGDNNSFRLRNAFGQWDRILAGQTWSAFVDTNATPEGVDFEGLNARINVRQSQVRFSPRFGKNFSLELSLEDPNPQLQDGNGITRVPDVVLAGRFHPHDRLHVKVALLGRQIRGQQTVPSGSSANGNVDKEYAGGLSISGSFNTPYFDYRDKFLFQVNKGNGIGRYVNDLNSIGNYDGIFNQATGDLQLFNVFATYGSLQHWWGDTSRSNFTLGYVDINNPGFVEGDAYKRTIRASANFMWNPIVSVDTGIEYLWGRRENKDGGHGDAQQIQMMIRYMF